MYLSGTMRACTKPKSLIRQRPSQRPSPTGTDRRRRHRPNWRRVVVGLVPTLTPAGSVHRNRHRLTLSTVGSLPELNGGEFARALTGGPDLGRSGQGFRFSPDGSGSESALTGSPTNPPQLTRRTWPAIVAPRVARTVYSEAKPGLRRFWAAGSMVPSSTRDPSSRSSSAQRARAGIG
jgi:hypothetical protein